MGEPHTCAYLAHTFHCSGRTVGERALRRCGGYCRGAVHGSPEVPSRPETVPQRLRPAPNPTAKQKNSLYERTDCLFLERLTRLELATSTLARWRSTR